MITHSMGTAQQINAIAAQLVADRITTPQQLAALIVATASINAADFLRHTLGWHTSQREQLINQLEAKSEEAMTIGETA